MDAKRKAFYEYHAALMEPWDGPAAIAFTDGRQIGATLDRNGLRPARYIVTDDDLIILASESGVIPVAEEKIKRKWRLQPGKMLLIDFEEGRIVEDEEIKKKFSDAEPYDDWLKSAQFKLEDLPDLPEDHRAKAADPSLLLDSAAGLWLHPGRPAIFPGADGGGGRRPAGLDGRRHADRRAVEEEPSCSTIISSRTSPRSPIRRSIRSAKSW